jgi:hypothetical protein
LPIGVDAGGGEAVVGLGPRRVGQRTPATVRTGGGVEHVGQVGEELAVLAPHDGGVGLRLEAGGAQIGGHGFGGCIGARGVAAQIEHARDGRLADLDHPGLEV